MVKVLTHDNQYVISKTKYVIIKQKICDNKTKDVKAKLFNIITAINESKAVVKSVSCNCKCRFDSKKLKTKME